MIEGFALNHGRTLQIYIFIFSVKNHAKNNFVKM